MTSQEANMPNYNQAHAFYAGVDLHARSLFVHIQSANGGGQARRFA